MDRTNAAVGRLRRAVATYGTAGLAQEASRRARTWAHRAEEHLWWELDLRVERTPHPMPDGFVLCRLPESDVDLAADLRVVNFEAAAERYRRGGEFWTVQRAGRLVFGVWMFPSSLPVHAVPGGWVGVPPGVIGMEDGAVAPEASRANIALPALDHIAEHYREQGAHAIVAKTAVTNRPVFVLLTRAGYRRAAPRVPCCRCALTVRPTAPSVNAGSRAAMAVPFTSESSAQRSGPANVECIRAARRYPARVRSTNTGRFVTAVFATIACAPCSR